ncbi:MAG: hypothetical protein NC541_06430 [bacterium]|nr:hypothetical protein [bacterium]
MLMRNLRELKLWKRRPVQILGLLYVGLILFCIIRIAIPCKVYQYSGERSFAGTAAGQSDLYTGIQLPPGVYRVELSYSTDSNLQSVCSVADDTVLSGALLSNGEPLYSGLAATSFDMWLFEGTDSLRVQIAYGGQESLTTGNLTVYETNGLWTMLLTVLLMSGIVLAAALAFYDYDRMFSVDRGKKLAFLFVTAIGLAASTPYLCGYSLAGADLTYHLLRIEGVKDGLLNGYFPVRLEPEWLYGHGYANGIFYCNALLYFPAVLRLLGFTVTASYNFYCVALNLAAAWIAYHCFYKILRSRTTGILCSGLYVLSVQRIYKLVIIGATGEGSAMTFLPLVLYGLYRVFTEDADSREYRTAWLPLAAGVAGLAQTHVLTCEVTVLVILLFCAANLRRLFRKRTMLELVKAAAAAVGASLWFLVPFADYYLTQNVRIKHASARTIQDRGLYPAQLAFQFWRDGSSVPQGNNGMQHSHPMGVGVALAVGLGIFLILWFSGKFHGEGDKHLPFIKKTAVIGSILLFMSLNMFPWDRIQSLNAVTAALVSSLQFTNRLLGWATVCLVLVFGYCLRYFRERREILYQGAVLVAIVGVATSGIYLLDDINEEQDRFWLYNEEAMGVGYISGAEYLIEGTDSESITYTGPKAGEDVEILSYEKGALRARVRCRNQGDGESFVEVPLLLYKGYRALDTDTGEKLKVTAGNNNVVRVLLPPGYAGEADIRFVSPFYWRIGEWISVFTLLFLAVRWRRDRRAEHVRD